MQENKTTYSFSREENWVINKVSKLQTPHNKDLDTVSTHNFAIRNGLAPFLFHFIKDNKNQIEEELYTLLKKSYLNSFIRNTQLINVWVELKTLFESHNLKPIPLKGIVLATLIYPDPALRPMSDLDILFLNEEYKSAHKLLLSNGGITNETQAEHDKKTGHQLPSITYKGILIEIHRSLFDTDIQQNIPITIIKNQLTKVNDQTIFTPEINFIYLCLHTYHTIRRGGVRLSWFLDLVLFAQSNKIAISAEKFTKLIEELNLIEPIISITSKAAFLFSFNFKFIPNRYKKKLTLDEERAFIKLIHQSDQQDTNYSYGIALERIQNTKGFFNKLAFIKSVLNKNNNNFMDTFKRFVTVSSRLFKYFIRKKN